MFRVKKFGLTKLLKFFGNTETEKTYSNKYDITVTHLKTDDELKKMKKYCEYVGKVREMKCFTSVMFIKYENPVDIQRFLSLPYKNVRLYNYWDQYLYRKYSTGEADILKLNDDCLYEIFDWLKLEDRINLAKTCKQMMNALMSKERYDEIDLDQEPFRDEEKLRSFLVCFALDVETVTCKDGWYSFQVNLLKLVVDICKNLTTIRIYHKSLGDVIPLINKVSNLRELSLVNCTALSTQFQSMSNLQNLESFDFSHSKIYTEGRFLPKLQNLKNLNISFCQGIDAKSLETICLNNPQLITLNMRNTPCIDQSSINALILHCKEIKVLKINHHFFTDKMLMQFVNLKYLSELDISYCESFRTQGLLNLIKDSPKLTCINIKGCRQIGKNFLVEAIELLKNQSQRIERCEIVTTLEKDETIINRVKEEPSILINFE